MADNIVIVESPAKSKTLKKYLGKNFEILASYGHVRDLVPKEGAVDPENDFALRYQLIDKNIKHVNNICQALKRGKCLYLATDPDREGEAISWHLYEILKSKGNLLEGKEIKRIAFNEITKKAVLAAVDSPRELSKELVNAQQARRALDYLVGFNLSPLLWKKIRRGLSAGRVQSPALRMIVEREEEIQAFVSKEFWKIEADIQKENQVTKAKLFEYKTKKMRQFSVTNQESAEEIKEIILKACKGKIKVVKVTKSQRKRNPAPPFITSTLQQEAARKLGFTASKTMRVAQQLYEGVDFGSGSIGLISYMRTDSVNLSEDALKDIRSVIADRYGKTDLPKEPIQYKTKAKNAQEAHEAIRPTSCSILPQEINGKVTNEQYKLYNLIWKRTVASQMIHATIDQVAVDFGDVNLAIFRANGSTIKNPGFMKVYQEGVDDKDPEKIKEEDEKFMPAFSEGEELELKAIGISQHFTEPPPRYTEASLVKTLEEHGIGRPSTYASIISTIQNRDYAKLEQKRFTPTDVGCVVIKFLKNYFPQYVDYNFTAKLEDDLDAISRGEKEMVPLLKNFWVPFKTLVSGVEKSVKRSDVTQEKLDEQCPECGKDLSIRLGRNGKFIGCTGYPDCSYTRSVASGSDKDESEKPELEVVKDRKCPECESDLIIREGKYGKFIGCSAYPKCKHIESLFKPIDTKITCSACSKGTLFQRKSRYNTFFYSCSEYPKCKYAVKYEPVGEPCPKCSWPILTKKVTKKSGEQKFCPQEKCDYKE